MNLNSPGGPVPDRPAGISVGTHKRKEVLGMRDKTAVKARKGLPVWAVALISAGAAVLVVIGVAAALLGREGIALMGSWVLARWAFVEEDADLGSAANGAMYGLVSGLGDRWSYYVDPESYTALQDRRANRYLGIGVTVDYTDERGLTVRLVNAGGPAEKAGIKEGELIVAVDGHDLSGDARYDGTALIAGERGQVRKLTLLDRTGVRREVEVKLDYIAREVVSGRLLENGMGLVTIVNFNTNAAEGLKETVGSLVEQGARALIFDVRNNGGGYINELTRMLDFLLPEGEVFRSDPRWGLSSVKHSDEGCIALPMGVLVNSESYSAAELFAAQLRESIGAPIVGELTSGKGYSQNTFRLANGGALGLSTARYCTGSGVSLIGTGITPDAEVTLNEEQAARLSAGVLEPEEDPQLQALIELMDRT